MGDIVIHPQGRRGVTASQELAASPRRNSGANRKEEGKQGRRQQETQSPLWLTSHECYLLFFRLYCTACSILVPPPGIELTPPVVEA